jgi:hypothetical protein
VADEEQELVACNDMDHWSCNVVQENENDYEENTHTSTARNMPSHNPQPCQMMSSKQFHLSYNLSQPYSDKSWRGGDKQ